MTDLGPISGLAAAEALCPSAADPLMGPDAEPMQQPRPVRTSIIGERAPIFRGAGVAIAVGVRTGPSAWLVAYAGRETRGRSLREPEVGV